ncbi:hypothetical protein NLG97_g3285 [Lecanicillium saksenae]|uniref:Uncharacterized protein n=1 Tax=Lecanicillium saksenae TaxID=468837 RepID=A0ACC1QZR9_9HYPO|nr:hypothetical protein NLG97_g3285 [Lecanicillium saksenae]
MDTSHHHEDASENQQADAPSDSKPASSQAEDEPRVVANNQHEHDIATPEELPSPSYTFRLYAPALAGKDSEADSAVEDEQDDLYSDDRETPINSASIARSEKSSSPEMQIEQYPRTPPSSQDNTTGNSNKISSKVHWRTQGVHNSYDSITEESEDEEQDTGVNKAEDSRPQRKKGRPDYIEEQRDNLRQQAYVERQAIQRQCQPHQVDTEIKKHVFPPGIPVSDENAVRYLHRLQVSNPDQFTPFREARVPELPELSLMAQNFNARARVQEEENVRRAERPDEECPTRSIWGRILDIALSFGPEKVDSKGVWLCAACTTYLDTLNPREEDRINVEKMHVKFGIWPPFKQVPGVNRTMKKCARCQKNNFCTLWAFFESE